MQSTPEKTGVKFHGEPLPVCGASMPQNCMMKNASEKTTIKPPAGDCTGLPKLTRGATCMSVERALFAFGGSMVMLTSLLALFHHPNWTWFTLFIGFNCLQSSFTGFCPPTWVMKKFGMKTEAQLALENAS